MRKIPLEIPGQLSQTSNRYMKSSGYNRHVSLDEFCNKYSQHIGRRYLIYTKDLKKDGQTLLLPAYMTMFL